MDGAIKATCRQLPGVRRKRQRGGDAIEVPLQGRSLATGTGFPQLHARIEAAGGKDPTEAKTPGM